MKKVLHELPIDVERLSDLLYQELSQQSRGLALTSSAAIKEYGAVLNANVNKVRLRKFLIGLRKIYGTKKEMQPQILMALFIKDVLKNEKLNVFKKLVSDAAHKTFSPRMKNLLLSELN